MKAYRDLMILIFFSILMTKDIYGQHKLTWLKDTIYAGGITTFKDVILYNGDSAFTVGENSIKEFYKIHGFRKNYFDDEAMVAINKKWYFINKDMSVDLNHGIDFKLCYRNMTFKGMYFKIFYPYIIYSVNDSIFIQNFKNNNRHFITKGGYPTTDNKKYILIQKDSYSVDKVFYIYIIKKHKLIRLPNKFRIPNTVNEWFVIERNDIEDYGSFVLDLNMNVIVQPEEKYHPTIVDKDILVLESDYHNLPIKFYYKNKLIKLPNNIVSFEYYNNNSGLIIVSNNRKYGAIDKTGKIIIPIEFDEIDYELNDNLLRKEYSIAKKNNYVYVYNKKLDVIFKGEYDDVRILDENRFAVRKNYRKKVVDSLNQTIIPFDFMGGDNYTLNNRFGIKFLIKWPNTLYTYTGKEIIKFNVEEGERIDSDKTIGSLFDNYSLKILKLFNKNQILEINKYDLWIFNQTSKKEKIKGKKKNNYYIINHNFQKIAGPFQNIYRIGASNRFLIKTHNKKHGILKID